MSDKDSFRTRRTVLQLAGVAVAGGSLAGCLDDSASTDDNEDDPTTNESPASADNSSDASDGEATDDTDTTIEGSKIEPGTTIEFDGQTIGWEGIAPSSIEGATNPTLVLEEGGSYEMGWTIGDGAQHNIEIRDDSGAVVNDLATEGTTAEETEDQFLEFEASSDMTTYICKFHETTMVGELQVE